MNDSPDRVTLPEERHSWRCQMLRDEWQEPHILAEYRKNRHSDLWRASKQAEQLCEYILHLECLLDDEQHRGR